MPIEQDHGAAVTYLPDRTSQRLEHSTDTRTIHDAKHIIAADSALIDPKAESMLARTRNIAVKRLKVGVPSRNA